MGIAGDGLVTEGDSGLIRTGQACWPCEDILNRVDAAWVVFTDKASLAAIVPRR